jgi:histidinol-phosphate aminotransferase
MPRLRLDLDSIVPYTPGRSIEEVAAELGLVDVAKLASNECPFPPWPEVVEAIAEAGSGVHRYPDNDHRLLAAATGAYLGVPVDHLWFGSGSSDILRSIALAMGGPGTSAVYAQPSFVLYRIITHIAGTEPVEVALAPGWVHDPEALVGAVRPDTTVLYICNPNNPTGTHISGDAIRWIIDQVPDRVLVFVDEAYVDYVDASDFETMLPVALERENVVVTRTFSKVHGLAGLRVGYAIGVPATLRSLRKAQAPFPVTTVGQAAATAALDLSDRLSERVSHNTRERARVLAALEGLGVEHAASQTNFVFHRSPVTAEAFTHRGVIVRAAGVGWARTTIGWAHENDRFLEALETFQSAGGDFA